MQVDDWGRTPPADRNLPESGQFVNFGRRRTLSERVFRFLERVRFVVPVRRERPRHRSPSTR
ncbi:MAG TPA: hypothetical protein VGO79_02670 [Thermoanaerobaculia bacterium]|jgi:hypothetical protein